MMKKLALRTKKQSRHLNLAEIARKPPLDIARLIAPAKSLVHADKLFKSRSMASDSASTPFADASDIFSGISPHMATQSFIGYPACANLSQYGLMQAGVGILADEVTRVFPSFTGSSPESSDAADMLNAELERLKVQKLFRDMARMCGFFGGGLLFIDTGRNGEDLQKPIAFNTSFVAKGGLKALIPVEPISIAPAEYNSTNPLAPDYFRVKLWYVSGVGTVHHSHFLQFVKTDVPVLLRPAYNFLGIPDVQLALDYFLHFTETRESAARLLKKFSLTVIKTNVDALLYGSDSSEVQKRIEHLAATRDNDGVYAISHEDEDIVQLNTPLGGVTDIVRQCLEMLACVWRYPVVKFLGVSPGGMNATGESDLRSFYDHVATQRENMFAQNFEILGKLLQCSVLGGIRDDVSYSWPTLWQETKKEQAEVAKLQADTDAVLLDRGVVNPAEVRSTLSVQEQGRYAGIAPEDVPEAPEELPAPKGEEGLQV